MKTTNILFLIVLSLIVGCHSIPKEKQTKDINKNYELIETYGILVEKFDSTVIDDNKYNQNNIIYKVGNSFTYSFEHKTPNGETKFFKIKNDDQNAWEFVDLEDIDSTTIQSVIIEVASGNPFADHEPDYDQTVLVYKIGGKGGVSLTGAIENEGNVWIHPPRNKYFKILELNPFPFIKAPYKIGTKWNWQLKIGDSWADDRWKLWEGQIENKFEYEITDKLVLETSLGKLECFVIKSKATSRIGETKLIAYFNLKYGFVKLNYTNIDGSKTKLKLIKQTENGNTNKTIDFLH